MRNASRGNNKSLGVVNLDGSQRDHHSGLAREVRQLTTFVKDLQIWQLTDTDRLALRSLLTELEAYVGATQARSG